MDFNEMYPGRFLKSQQFKGRDVTMTIRMVRLEELEGDKGKKTKGIVSFVERPLELVLNRTNGECLKAMFGRETNAWIGKRVTLWPAPYHDNTTGEDTTCIRVRGSPDLAADKPFDLKLARKGSKTVVMKRTGAPATPANGTTAAPSLELDPSQLTDDDAHGSATY